MRREEGVGSVFCIERVLTPCGEMILATDDEGILCALLWDADDSALRRLLSRHSPESDIRLELKRSPSMAGRSLDAYLAGDLRAIDAVPVRTPGTPFQEEVWAALAHESGRHNHELRRPGRATQASERDARGRSGERL